MSTCHGGVEPTWRRNSRDLKNLKTGNLLGIGVVAVVVVVAFVGGQTTENVPGRVRLSATTAGFGFGPVGSPSLLFEAPATTIITNAKPDGGGGVSEACVYFYRTSRSLTKRRALNKHLFGPRFVKEAAVMWD